MRTYVDKTGSQRQSGIAKSADNLWLDGMMDLIVAQCLVEQCHQILEELLQLVDAHRPAYVGDDADGGNQHR